MAPSFHPEGGLEHRLVSGRAIEFRRPFLLAERMPCGFDFMICTMSGIQRSQGRRDTTKQTQNDQWAEASRGKYAPADSSKSWGQELSSLKGVNSALRIEPTD